MNWLLLIFWNSLSASELGISENRGRRVAKEHDGFCEDGVMQAIEAAL